MSGDYLAVFNVGRNVVLRSEANTIQAHIDWAAMDRDDAIFLVFNFKSRDKSTSSATHDAIDGAGPQLAGSIKGYSVSRRVAGYGRYWASYLCEAAIREAGLQ